jgi:hypothetical protein
MPVINRACLSSAGGNFGSISELSAIMLCVSILDKPPGGCGAGELDQIKRSAVHSAVD